MSRFFKALEHAERDSKAEGTASPDAGSPARLDAGSAGPARPIAVTRPGAPAPPPGREPAAATVPIPRGSGRAPSTLDPRFVSLVDPTAFEAEQYRSLRHVVELAHRDRGLTILGMTSAGIGAGKTTTAVNLAGALAQDPDARVLLVDVDLRRPAIAAALPDAAEDVVPAPGLVDAILDPSLGLDDVVQPRPFNLSVLLAGGTPETPYELLKSSRLAGLLAEARDRYDYVILDAPPLVPIADCRIIEGLVDGLLIVVGANRTPRKLLEEALDSVEPAKVLGLVFNAEEKRRQGYYAGYGVAYVPATNGVPSRWGRLLRRNGHPGVPAKELAARRPERP